jgi:choline dehydrogenase-like flavoprotein
VRYIHGGEERVQRADAVAVAGYSIETPRLLLNSTSRRYPHGLANNNDQVGRCVMVQGAPQVAGRFPDEMRMYKAPPPEICSEQFYETDPTRGFARGFSIQTVGPLPIEWAQHVMADGHWGRALREYMRDYNHWYTLGILSELLPLPENRVTVDSELTDQNGIPVARMEYTQCENDRKNIAFAKQTLHDVWDAAGAQDVLVIDRYAHLVGGCRMGVDPERSVVDSDHRAWGIPNLFIADGSVMPTQGSANPALTIMALASRLAQRLADGRLDAPAATARRSSGRRRTGPSPPSDPRRPAPAGSRTDES